MSKTENLELPFLDSHTAAFGENPTMEIAASCPCAVAARGRHGIEFLTYDVVGDLFKDRQFRPIGAEYFADQGASPIVQEFVEQGLLLLMPDARHDHVRRILMKGFTPRRIESWRPVIRQFANDLIDMRAPYESMEFLEDFAFHFSVGVIARFIGVPPEDIPLFSRATVTLRLVGERPLAPHLPALEEGLGTIKDYVTKLVDRRRVMPAGDFISDVLEMQRTDGTLSDSEVVWGIANLLLAGHDTTRYQLASVIRAVIEANAWEQIWAAPLLVPAAVREGMRLYPVTLRNSRIAITATSFKDNGFFKGQLAVLNMGAAGRDPSHFENPDKFDLQRENDAWDIGFGRGPHMCLGFALAMAEMTEAVGVLSQRLTDVSIDGPIAFAPPTGALLYLESLPLRFRMR